METIRADLSPSEGCTPPLSAQIWPPTEIVLWIALAVSHHGRWLEKDRLTVYRGALAEVALAVHPAHGDAALEKDRFWDHPLHVSGYT